ncbi:hypothetical protein DS513_18155 [Salmonella enterica subsp. enterica serovar Sandiego]|nr:hypothetical protein [Salmonella enterica subsp. enterica serovar Sandiego]
MMTGEWKVNPHMETCNLPDDVATLFTEATESLIGAEYSPVLYPGKQLVSGCNYMFICKQTLMTVQAETHIVKMVIHKPENSGQSTVISVESLF